MQNTPITVEVWVDAPLKEVWKYWTEPQHILRWNQPADDWHTTAVENDPKTGGKFLFVMKAKNGSDGFDFQGVYDQVIDQQLMTYTLSDGRKTKNLFTATAEGTTITETFDPAPEPSEEMQRAFCTSVLETFKKFVEGT